MNECRAEKSKLKFEYGVKSAAIAASSGESNVAQEWSDGFNEVCLQHLLYLIA